MIRDILLGGTVTRYDDAKQCTSFAYQGNWPHVCGRPVKVQRGERGYCGIHDPVALKARADKREAIDAPRFVKGAP